MSADHSPLPWSINYGHDIHDARGDLVAQVFGTEPNEEQANLRLLAAAPQMLDALKAVESLLSLTKLTGLLTEVQAAVRNAEGR